MSPTSPHRRPGFTLVELLVSLALLSLLALLVLTGVTTGQRAWRRLDERAGRMEQIAAVQGRLRLLVERSFPQTRFDADQPFVDFRGTPDEMAFIAPPPAAARPAALRYYRLTVTPRANLVLDSVSTVAADPSRFDSRLILLQDVGAVEFAYFGAAPPDDRRRWRRRWVDRPTMPELVRINLRLKQGDRRFWPTLIVRPAANADVACIFDPQTSRCR